jgi:hypothetical protein
MHSASTRFLSSARREDGAITVVGLFMACFLTGAIWYVVGIASAVLYRERVQDAADAVAFAGAVYHARGMNIIATLNILMSALLGLLVTVRLLRYLNDSANVIACGCQPVPFIGPACASVCRVTSSVRQPLSNLETRLTGLYNRVGPALSKTQVGVARAMPWIAELKGVGVSRNFQPDVRFGVIASFSLVPRQERLGLPVQEGEEKVLCDKVKGGLVDLVFRPVENIRGIGMVRGWLEDPLSEFVERFCAGGELVDPERAAEIERQEEDDQVARRCDYEQALSHALAHPAEPISMGVLQQGRALHAEGTLDLRELQCYPVQRQTLLADLPGFGSYRDRPVPDAVRQVPDVGELLETQPGEPPPQQSLGCAFNRNTCETRARDRIRAAREAEPGSGNVETSQIDPQARQQTTPKVVFEPARNGNGYFQVWSLVAADGARAEQPARIVELAAHGRARAGDTSLWSRLGWAQAEFYYDQEGAWADDTGSHEALWNLRWRARLRRVRPPTINILESVAGTVLGKIEERVQAHIGPTGDEPRTVIDLLLQMSFDRASQEIESRVNDAAVAGDNALERRARQAWRRFGGVH